jgi:hypothetical protein
MTPDLLPIDVAAPLQDNAAVPVASPPPAAVVLAPPPLAPTAVSTATSLQQPQQLPHPTGGQQEVVTQTASEVGSYQGFESACGVAVSAKMAIKMQANLLNASLPFGNPMPRLLRHACASCRDSCLAMWWCLVCVSYLLALAMCANEQAMCLPVCDCVWQVEDKLLEVVRQVEARVDSAVGRVLQQAGGGLVPFAAGGSAQASPEVCLFVVLLESDGAWVADTGDCIKCLQRL